MPLLLATTIYFSGCRGTGSHESANVSSSTQTSVTVEAEKFIEKSANVSVISHQENTLAVKTTDSASWLTYKVEIPVSGRYNVLLYARNSGEKPVTCWVEDYIDNKDGRTYNITGSMIVNEDSVVQKDGSPLAAATHLMKLHVSNSSVIIDKIVFELIRIHKPSPKVLKQNTLGKEWKLVWSDEFNGTGLPDTNKWTFDVGNWGWGNNELEYYTEQRTENARQENGNLIIEARKNDSGMPWSSARITTRGKESFLYGKIEFKAKVPSGRGTWSAGWLLGDAYTDEISWPYCGEVDILENVGFEIDSLTGNGKTHASIHCGAYYFKLGNQPTAITDVANLSGAFHTYSLEWFPDRIEIFIDEKKYFEYSDTSSALSWPYNNPQNIILNLAIGGGWGGAKGVDASLTTQSFIIDYVRVYERQ